jgi:hypothetical protein
VLLLNAWELKCCSIYRLVWVFLCVLSQNFVGACPVHGLRSTRLRTSDSTVTHVSRQMGAGHFCTSS